ncbi:hypothetical protein ACKVWC_011588 [Pyricularia oryzae]
MNLGKGDSPLGTLAGPQMGVCDDWEPLLVPPGQVADVAHGDGEDGPAGSDAKGDGCSGAEHDVAAARHDAAGHGGDQHVDQAGHQALAALARRGKRGQRRREGLLQVESPVHGRVDAVLGHGGLAVQEQPCAPDLCGQLVRWRRAPGDYLLLLLGRFCERGRGG